MAVVPTESSEWTGSTAINERLSVRNGDGTKEYNHCQYDRFECLPPFEDIVRSLYANPAGIAV
jgi:hypothetical protein